MSAQILAFKRKDPVIPKNTIHGIPVNEPETRAEYLVICKKFLDIQDYEYILCGILDKEYYEFMEAPLKKVVDSYYEFPR